MAARQGKGALIIMHTPWQTSAASDDAALGELCKLRATTTMLDGGTPPPHGVVRGTGFSRPLLIALSFPGCGGVLVGAANCRESVCSLCMCG